jgi:hypothetical protein
VSLRILLLSGGMNYLAFIYILIHGQVESCYA